MTKAEILFNYSQAMAQADKLDGLSGRLSKVVSKGMDPALETLKISWTSDYSDQYFRKADTVIEGIKKSSENLAEIAESIRKTARSVRNAELRALEVAKQRSY